MKLGELITMLWQYNNCSAVIGGGIRYVTANGKEINLNDLRCIWQMLNQEIQVESTIRDAIIEPPKGEKNEQID